MTVTAIHINDPVRNGDIALRCGVVPACVTMWRQRNLGFPEPAAVIGDEGLHPTELWEWSEVEDWWFNRYMKEIA